MRWLLGIFTALAAFAAIHAHAATNPDAIAVIIGNRNYSGRDVPEVKYADRDAQAIKRYVIDVLGYDEKNVIYVENAPQSRILALFGTESEPGIVSRWLRKDGSSDLFVFYSGHGVPGLKDGQSYLLPVDGDPSAGQLNGYSLKLLYANLEKTTAKTITVLLDACFAGQSGNGVALIRNASVLVRPADPAPKEVTPRMTVIAASGADEVANWDDTSKHGLFTEYFLRAVYGAADSPKYGGKGDGRITAALVHNYLDKEMSYFAGREIGRDQNASFSGDPNEVLAAFQPGHPFTRGDLKPAPTPVVPAILPLTPAPTPTPAPAPVQPSPPSPPRASTAAADEMTRNAMALRQQGRFEQAVALFRQAADAGSAAAMNALGEAYGIGQGVVKDPAQALVWYRKAAQLGNANAMNLVGYSIEHGIGTAPGDLAEALKWYRWSAERGDPGGANNVAYAYMNGRGVERDVNEGVRLFKKAADMGSTAAMHNLGYDYSTGIGVMRDDAEAARWYRRGAEAGHVPSMYDLGQMYRTGRAGQVDLAAATQWLRRASDAGSEPAKKALAEMQTAMAAPPAPIPTPYVAPYVPPQPDPASVEAGLNLTQPNRVALQRGLSMLGFATGGADGEFGPMTRQAVAAYQRRSGFTSTGYLTRETVDRLVNDIKARDAAMAPAAPAAIPAVAPSSGSAPGSAYGDERRDFGVPPQTWLQANVGNPTPTSIPGGARIVYTQELIRALNTPSQTPFVIIDVLDGAPHASIRGALRMPLAGHGGTFNDITQQTVAGQLNQATGGRRDTPLVFLCAGPRCWESYNAALRAMQAGYQHVYWYRGGLESWAAAGQPIG